MMQTMLFILVSFAAASIAAYIAFGYFAGEGFEESLFPGRRHRAGLKDGLLKMLGKIKEKLLFLKGVDTSTETSYFLMLFLLYLHSGLSIRTSVGKAYLSISSMGFTIGRYLNEMISRIDSGTPYAQSIKVLDKFPEVDALREAFSNIFQAQELGTPIEDSVRTTIDEMEKGRVTRAEERASKMAVFIAIPLVLGFLPCIMILVAYPALAQILKMLTGVAR